MRVDSSSHSTGVAQAHRKQHPRTDTAEQKPAAKAAPKSAEKAEESRQQPQAKGVMRLMQEGHFKGVAALRLRINFYDQLSAQEQSNIQEAVREGMTELTDTVQQNVDGMIGSGVLSEEQLPQVKELTDTLFSDLQATVAGEEPDGQRIVSQLEQLYADYDAALRDLLLQPETLPAEEAETVAAVARADEPQAVEPLAAGETQEIVDSEPAEIIEKTTSASLSPGEEEGRQAHLLESLTAMATSFRSHLSDIEEGL